MKYQKHLIWVSILFLSACGSLTTDDLTPVQVSNALPDLVVSRVHIAMQGVPVDTTDCVAAYAPYEVRATIENRGSAPAVNIPIIELSTGYMIQISELSPGQSMDVSMPASSQNGMYNVSVDSQNLIEEIDESNNTASYLAPTPTPPVLCSPPETPLPNLPTSVPAGGEAGNAALSLTVLRNAVYHSPDWGGFQLTDGVFYRTPSAPNESPAIYTTRFHNLFFYGDINADGLEDALVFLNTQNGGTGHFIELAAVLNQNGSAYNISTIFLGDRVVVESGKVENGIIVLNMRVQGPNDGLCCPSQFVTWNFVLSGDQLMKLP